MIDDPDGSARDRRPGPPRGIGTDFLQLDRTAAPSRGLTEWLAGELRTAVADGRLDVGTPLPASRVLAEGLGISRGVVVEAYRRLCDEGIAEGRVGSGTMITAVPATGRPGPPHASRAPMTPSSPLIPAGSASPEFDLSPGVPDLSAFPRAAWLRAERTVLQGTGARRLGYADPRGDPWLRTELARWLGRTRGLRAGPDDILVVSGVAQALALLAQTLHATGTSVLAVEDPGSLGARQEVRHWGLEPIPVAVDDDGLRVEDLARTDAQAVLLTPAHQFPTGVVLAPRRRRDLLTWATGDRLVIEDDYDAEHRYDRTPVPALQAFAPDQVAHTGSTSKTLAPGLRLGWVVPPPRLYGQLVAARYASDICGPVLPQLVLAQLLATGELDRHLRQVRHRQRTRRDTVLTALRQHAPQTRVLGIAAGLHLLVLLPESTDDHLLAERAEQVGIRVHPLSWHRIRPGPPGLVLGYAALPPDRLHEAITWLARILPA
jgi:GntR family transcriptional regulator/MocR family aminotransferase